VDKSRVDWRKYVDRSEFLCITIMSFKKLEIYPANPSTTRGSSTKLSSSKDRVIYASGKTVIVRIDPRSDHDTHAFALFSYAISRSLFHPHE
jgi:hypothetical protein